jgi:spermidine synthase
MNLEPGPKIRILLLLGISFFAGAAVMVVELAAARILTPYFGQSVFVWTNVIGVILASVAVGNYLGGLMADRARSLKTLFCVLALAGALCLAVPGLIRRVPSFFLGEGLQLEEAFSLLVRGSFATTIIVFAPPVLLLGMALPFLVKSAAQTYAGVGRASGSIYAASTIGSITGTFLTTYVLTEALGSRGTFYCAGGALIVAAGAGFLCLGRPGRGSLAGLILIVAAGVASMAWEETRAAERDGGTVFERESRYQYIRVVEKDASPRTLHLCINEGLDSFHSIYREGAFLTGGQYFDYYALLPGLAGKEVPGKVGIIGLAAGTIARQYAHFFGGEAPRKSGGQEYGNKGKGSLEIVGVEIDPAVVEAGYACMDLAYADPWMRVCADIDGRVFLDASDGLFDVLVIDAYARQIYIPFHMATEEFFRSVHARLAEGGIFGLNLSGFDRDEPVIKAIANSAAAVFGTVGLARIPDGRNFMLYGVKGRGFVPPRECDAEAMPEPLRPLLARISVYGLTRKVEFDDEGQTLTDDRAPVELMSDRTLMSQSTALVESVYGGE